MLRLHSITRARVRRGVARIRPVLRALLLVAFPTGAMAQTTAPRLVLGAGMLLTRDRGWNFGPGLEFTVAGEAALSSMLAVRLGASVLASACPCGVEPIYPPPPQSLGEGLALQLHLRTRPHGWGPYALAGAEVLTDASKNWPGRASAGAAAGLGIALGGHASIESRYVAFARRLGTSHGVLSTQYVHRF